MATPNGWFVKFILENPSKMDDFGVPQKFQETSMYYPGPGPPSFAVSLASFFLILIQAMLTEWLVAYCEHTGSLTLSGDVQGLGSS